ncbi:MAG TPA: hypothetical protein VFP84_11985 [Kofleriaceae bacterium]|nr:hypothetical protein [Kofleriaceae bacterium]
MTSPRAAWLAVALVITGCERDARAPAPPGDHAQPVQSSSPMITADALRTWSEQLCTQPALDFDAAIQALGLSGALVKKSSDYAVLEPPPPGTTRVGLSRENLGKNKGYLGMIELELATKLPRAELDHRFGAGNVLPIADVGRGTEISYEVTVPGAPYRCTVFANFDDATGPSSLAGKIRLRRAVVRTPQ